MKNQELKAITITSVLKKAGFIKSNLYACSAIRGLQLASEGFECHNEVDYNYIKVPAWKWDRKLNTSVKYDKWVEKRIPTGVVTVESNSRTLGNSTSRPDLNEMAEALRQAGFEVEVENNKLLVSQEVK